MDRNICAINHPVKEIQHRRVRDRTLFDLCWEKKVDDLCSFNQIGSKHILHRIFKFQNVFASIVTAQQLPRLVLIVEELSRSTVRKSDRLLTDDVGAIL